LLANLLLYAGQFASERAPTAHAPVEIRLHSIARTQAGAIPIAQRAIPVVELHYRGFVHRDRLAVIVADGLHAVD